MEPAQLSGFAVFAGSVVVALGSLASAWLTKKHEARARRASENKVGRQKLYAQFIEEASKLYVDALVRDQAEASAMVGIYALISQMRMASNANVVEKAEAVIRTILGTYSRRRGWNGAEGDGLPSAPQCVGTARRDFLPEDRWLTETLVNLWVFDKTFGCRAHLS